MWHGRTRLADDLSSCRPGQLLPGSSAFTATRPMARSMRDGEIIRNGVYTSAGVIEMAPVPALNGKVEKGGA